MCLAKQLFESSSDAVYGTDQSRRINYWNTACSHLFGCSAEEVVGRKCHEVICGDDLSGKTFCGPGCPLRKKHSPNPFCGNYDIVVTDARGKSHWVNIGAYRVPPEYRSEAQGVEFFFSLRVVSGQRLVQRLVSEARNTPEKPSVKFNLTPRETEVLHLTVRGKHSPGIAKQLGISPATVKNHFKNIYAKMGVHSRAEAVANAYQYGGLQSI